MAPDLRRDVGLDRRDVLLGNRLDRLGFACLAEAKPFHGTQCPPDGFRHQFSRHTPFERLADATDVLVDPLAADSGFDQLLAAGHKGQRAEAGDRLPTIELPDGTEGRTEAADFAGGLAVFDVPLLGMLPEGQDQLVDTDRYGWRW